MVADLQLNYPHDITDVLRNAIFWEKKGLTTNDYGTLKLLIGERLKRVCLLLYYWEILSVVVDNSFKKQMNIALHQRAAKYFCQLKISKLFVSSVQWQNQHFSLMGHNE